MPDSDFTITFDGESVPVRAGQTLAAALIAAGHNALRPTRVGAQPRGVFCGIGVCFDCLVTVNGTRSVRACLVAAQPGDEVSSELGVERDDLII